MAYVFGKKPTAEMDALLRRAGSRDIEVHKAAMHEIAVALTLPLQEGVMDGDVHSGIYERIDFGPGEHIEFPLDFISPGTERQYAAYTIPHTGRIPERKISGDYIAVTTYDTGASMDWDLKYARDARWDIVGRVLQVLEAMFTAKKNKDAWETIISAAKGRNVVVYDDAATAGLFTKRVISLAEIQMKRSGGGNSTSAGRRGKLTDVWMGPEAFADMRDWDLTQVDDLTRRAIFLAEDGPSNLFGVRLHVLEEFGVGQPFQEYYENIGGTLPSDKVELMVGLDLKNRDAFVHPVKEEVRIYEDTSFFRSNRASLWGRQESGWSVLSSARTLCLAI